MQKSISIDYDIEWHHNDYKILFNEYAKTGDITIQKKQKGIFFN